MKYKGRDQLSTQEGVAYKIFHRNAAFLSQLVHVREQGHSIPGQLLKRAEQFHALTLHTDMANLDDIMFS